MPTALIADDDEAPRAQLAMALGQVWPELEVAVECINGVDAWDAVLEHAPEVCFLDVRMPGLTGIEVAQRIGTRAHVVFVTVPGDHALAAFEAASVDFVSKPVDADRLAPAVARVRERLAAPGGTPADLQQLLNQLVGQVRKPAPLDMVQAGVGPDGRLVRVEDVLYFEADGRCTRVVYSETAGGETGDGEVLIRTPLKELTAQLDPAQFRQIDRSMIVNQRHIASAVPQGEGRMVLTLRGRGEKLPVAPYFQGLFRCR